MNGVRIVVMCNLLPQIAHAVEHERRLDMIGAIQRFHGRQVAAGTIAHDADIRGIKVVA